MNKVYQKDDLEILIATMNRSDLGFLVELFPFIDYKKLNIVIVNQTSDEKLLKSDIQNIKVINSLEKGLSKSRNVALQNATKDIVLITDDDVVFKSDFNFKIVEAFNQSQLDYIQFQIENENGILFRKYPKHIKSNLNWFEILNTHSIEMTFLRQKLIENNLTFDENFGLNAAFPFGEEAVFLTETKNKKLKLGFYPVSIVKHEQLTSTQTATKSKIYYTQGAVFYKIFKNYYSFWLALKLFFDLKQKLILNFFIISKKDEVTCSQKLLLFLLLPDKFLRNILHHLCHAHYLN